MWTQNTARPVSGSVRSTGRRLEVLVKVLEDPQSGHKTGIHEI